MPATPRLPRPGGRYVELFNSGLEVWLYDESHREALRRSGALAFGRKTQESKYRTQARKGRIVAYSLRQDDALSLAVYVGDPLTDQELSESRWLEPQVALLDLPSGQLCVETNDSCRLLPDGDEPGGRLDVPPGRYRLTLYRVDHETLAREGLPWSAPQEIVVLTPGGRPADAAEALLPFRPRRDRTWVEKYAVAAGRADALVWFFDARDTFAVNLDARAVEALGLKHGGYFRTRVPAVGLELTSVFGPSWREARTLPLPDLDGLVEYGFATLSPLADWDGAVGLFARRERGQAAVPAAALRVWHPATVELLAVGPRRVVPGPNNARFEPLALADVEHCDAGFLAFVLGDVLGTSDLDELPWPEALARLDAAFASVGLQPAGDAAWRARYHDAELAYDLRLYAGAKETFGVVLTREASLELLLISALADGSWLATGLADTLERIRAELQGRGLDVASFRLQNCDQPFAALAAAHAARLASSATRPNVVATDADSAREALGRFFAAVFP